MSSIATWYQNQYRKKDDREDNKQQKNKFTIDSKEYKQSLAIILQSLFVVIQKRGFTIQKYDSPGCFHSQCDCEACEFFEDHETEFMKLIIPSNADTIVLKNIRKVQVECYSTPWQKCSREQFGFRDCRPQDWAETKFTYFTDGNLKMKHIAGIVKILRNKNNGYDFTFDGGNGEDFETKILEGKQVLKIYIKTQTKNGGKECAKCDEGPDNESDNQCEKECSSNNEGDALWTKEFTQNYQITPCPLHKNRFVFGRKDGKNIICGKSCQSKSEIVDYVNE